MCGLGEREREREREREGVLYTIDKSTHSVRRKISGIELKPLRNGKEKELGLKGGSMPHSQQSLLATS